MSTVRKLIFLDVDGVLNNDETLDRPSLVDASKYEPGSEELKLAMMRDMIEPRLVARFMDLIKRSDGAEIVISSSWRNHFSNKDQMRAFFDSVGIPANLIIGRTPYTYDGLKMSMGPRRGYQIQKYLEDNHKDEILSIVILDDNGGMQHLRPRFVQTDSTEGLTAGNVTHALRILREPGTEHEEFDGNYRH